MSVPTGKPASESAESSETPQLRIVNPQDLVYISSFLESEGSISDDPREIINNPAVAPQTLDTTPENLKGVAEKRDELKPRFNHSAHFSSQDSAMPKFEG